MARKTFPRAIYFDTNVLRDLRIGFSSSAFLELKEFCESLKIPLKIPHVVYLEWENLHRERLSKHKGQVATGIEEINQLCGLKQKQLRLPHNLNKKLQKVLKNRLAVMGFTIIKTPKTISLLSLIDMAAFKIPPFEIKGEKGFRDKVILDTIITDMIKNGIQLAHFLTNDLMFKDDIISKELAAKKLDLRIYSDIAPLTSDLNNAFSEAVKIIREENKSKLLSYLQTKRDEIIKYIMENAKMSEDFIQRKQLLSSDMEYYGKLERVIDFSPNEINDVLIGFASFIRNTSPLPENKEAITITVKAQLKVVVSQINIFNATQVKVNELNKFTEIISTTPRQYYRDPSELTLDKVISVEAIIEKDDQENYSNLELKRVLTY